MIKAIKYFSSSYTVAVGGYLAVSVGECYVGKSCVGSQVGGQSGLCGNNNGGKRKRLRMLAFKRVAPTGTLLSGGCNSSSDP